MALSASPLNERKRVKVYELRDNDWFDRGTGFCAVQAIVEDGRIYVESEDEPDRALLIVQIKKDDNYQKQQETLIVWTDPTTSVDMALSFQEPEGCAIVCSTIGEAQQRLDGELAASFSTALPSPELAHLEEIENVVRSASNTQQGRDALARTIIEQNFISRLTALVDDAEDLEDLPDLHRICTIMKTLILYNDNQLVEHIVRDEIILGVAGALEYDPDFPAHKANHRQFLAEQSTFKEVIPLEDLETRRKIHFVYRLQYLKDVALARILDDPSFSLFNSLIYFHQIEIVQYMSEDASFLDRLFSLIHSPDASAQKKKDAVALVQQCCGVAKAFQPTGRQSLYANLINAGLFPMITFALEQDDASVRVAGTDILVAVIDHDVIMMRNSIHRALNEKTKPITETLIDLLLVETDLGVKAQVADAIKVLMDSNIAGPPQERHLGGDGGVVAKMRNAAPLRQPDSFADQFFDQSATKLFQPLIELKDHSSLSNLSVHEISLYSHLVEILCFFLRQHSYKGRYFILSQELGVRVMSLIHCPERHLKLTVVKYIRTTCSIPDDYFYRQLVSFDLFSSLLDIIYQSMPRDNLLNSSILELFDFIAEKNIKEIIVHLVENYREKLEVMTYVRVFANLLLRYEEYKNPPLGTPPPDMDSSMVTSEGDTPHTRHTIINGGTWRWQGLPDQDAAQEAYFDADDDEEDELSRDHASSLPNGASPLSKPLVDYGDDEDEDDDNANIVVETPPSGRKSRLGSSDSPSQQLSSPNNHRVSSSSAEPPPTPPTSIAEKRRREEDEEDELGKLSANTAKRRLSSSSSAGAGLRRTDSSSSWESTEGDEQRSPSPSSSRAGKIESSQDKSSHNSDEEKTSVRSFLKTGRKRGVSAQLTGSLDQSAGSENQRKKISINLGGKNGHSSKHTSSSSASKGANDGDESNESVTNTSIETKKDR